MKHEDYNDGFYHVGADIEKYPDALIIFAYSYRGPGKTTNGLWYMADKQHPFIYMKRTNDDVDFITGSSKLKTEYDVSPFKTVNRLAGTKVVARSLDKGFGGFYKTVDGEAVGLPIGYIVSLNKVKSIKGADMSECDFIILDECIPQVHEIVRHREGEALLDFWRTCQRDRLGRGLPPIKLILFSNSEELSCPITQTLDIIDDLAELTHSGEKYKYIKARKILLHHIGLDEAPGMTSTYDIDPLRIAMKGTSWEKKSYLGEFTNNDFSSVEKLYMKGMTIYLSIRYKNKKYYIYYRDSDGMYYMTFSKNKASLIYDLDKENDQKAFWIEEAQYLRAACIEGRMKFEKYSMYDLLMNYKKYFKI